VKDEGEVKARSEGTDALMLERPYAVVAQKPYGLGYITKARILYFLMATAAAMFVAADVVAEFDKDPTTHTATSYVKKFGKKGWMAAIIVALFPLWLLFHFTVPDFPL
jgi:hypothetical protein